MPAEVCGGSPHVMAETLGATAKRCDNTPVSTSVTVNNRTARRVRVVRNCR